MRALAFVGFVLLGPASFLAEGRTELEILRARCTEQERQIRALETEIESLHSQIALERRRARGATTTASTNTLPAPPSPAAAETYTVKTGDTLSSIARRYHTAAVTLMKENGIEDPTRLRVGQKLTLPSKSIVAKPAPTPKPAPVVASKPAPPVSKPAPAESRKPTDTYKIQTGDTLYGIARKHRMSLTALKELNPKIDADKILVGRPITVSGKANNTPNRTASLRSSSSTKTISTKTTSPAPKPAAKPAPKPAPKAVAKSTPNPAPEKPAAPKSISSIIVMDEISFGDFADKHGTTPDQLNSLNGLALKSSVTLAKGSELYVPGR